MRDAFSKKRSAMPDSASIDLPTSPHGAFPSASNASLLSPSAFAPSSSANEFASPASHSQPYPPAVKSAAAGELAYGTAPVLKVLKERFGVLASLLVLQSLSSVILQRYEQLLEHHVEITLFLTMVCKLDLFFKTFPLSHAVFIWGASRHSSFRHVPFFRSSARAETRPTNLPSMSFAALLRAQSGHLAAATLSLQPLAAVAATAVVAAEKACLRLPF